MRDCPPFLHQSRFEDINSSARVRGFKPLSMLSRVNRNRVHPSTVLRTRQASVAIIQSASRVPACLPALQPVRRDRRKDFTEKLMSAAISELVKASSPSRGGMPTSTPPDSTHTRRVRVDGRHTQLSRLRIIAPCSNPPAGPRASVSKAHKARSRRGA